MGGVLGWRRSCGRGQESEQEQTWEQERGLRATCDCGRDCDCDWDCHYGCDCACNRYRVRSTGGTRTLLVGSSGTRPSITVHGLACRGVQSSAAICARGPLGSRGSRSRGQDLEQERTREQAQGGGCSGHLRLWPSLRLRPRLSPRLRLRPRSRLCPLYGRNGRSAAQRWSWHRPSSYTTALVERVGGWGGGGGLQARGG